MIKMNINNIALFSLFHHDVFYENETFDYKTNVLEELSKENTSVSYEDIAENLLNIIKKNIQNIPLDKISLTLTGGMDSRIILACLLKLGIKPNCLTYGDSLAKDVLISKIIGDKYGLKVHNPINNSPDSKMYERWVDSVIQIDNGNSHLHRAHRFAAISEHVKNFDTKVLFTGHMGGEGIRGLTYNNYFASSFYENVNKKNNPFKEQVSSILPNYFVNKDKLDLDLLYKQVLNLSWMKNNSKINELYFLYDLIGKIHHYQDIKLYHSFVPNVVPVYLQKSYLEMLFSSQHHFLRKQNGFLGNLQNPKLYCQLLKIIYPSLLHVPLSNGYSPSEYTKGLHYYLPIRIWRKYINKQPSFPSFTYGEWYRDFVNKKSSEIDEEIWSYFNKVDYFNCFNSKNHQKNEGYWHRFSNPIFFDLILKNK